MTTFEYKVVPAPVRGLKGRGVKGTQARFANALQTVMNEMDAQGWEYQRTDTLPVAERRGLTGKSTSFQNMLVFRRTVEAQVADDAAVAALIEDQTAAPVVQEHVAESDAGQDDPVVGSEAEVAASNDTEGAVTDMPDAKQRVDETLNAPFSFPWNKRGAQPSKAANDTAAQTFAAPE